ncbi:MAG TPA: cytochrome c3 family protein [Armatimonadota bacterium]|nr:cytochrome c3 family protein [Armatimonadota bacterium]HQK93091.1 cytochrome c3 family protein [Armatimonadota bacterium]
MRAHWSWIAATAVALCLAALAQDQDAPPPAPEPTAPADTDVLDPMGPNGACYVCHMTFLREDLAKTHLKAKVTCIRCHGLSAAHANDENIGATKPDRLYERTQVSDSCRECHATHEAAPERVIQLWLDRELTEVPPVCTDCHGTHRIDAPAPQQPEVPPTQGGAG